MLTWQADISQHCPFTVFDTADLGKIDIQSQKGYTTEKGHGAHKDTIVTGILIAVEDAVLHFFIGAVDVALIGNATEDHYGEELQRKERG